MNRSVLVAFLLAALHFFVFCIGSANAQSYTLKTLATFNGADGQDPLGGLIMDSAGNLYGTTNEGGNAGEGTVFKLDASNGYAISTLANFNGTNGGYPKAGLTMDRAGNLFGTTFGEAGNGGGTVFKLDASNGYALSTLVNFAGTNGGFLWGGVTMDVSGNLYGTTAKYTAPEVRGG